MAAADSTIWTAKGLRPGTAQGPSFGPFWHAMPCGGYRAARKPYPNLDLKGWLAAIPTMDGDPTYRVRGRLHVNHGPSRVTAEENAYEYA